MFALSVDTSSLSRRIRAGILMLSLIAVLAAALAPLCDSFCCASSSETSIHALMPCCAGESNMSRNEPVREERSTSTAARVSTPQPPPVAAVIATLAAPPAPATRFEETRIASRHEPSPPLFLLNAQFLI